MPTPEFRKSLYDRFDKVAHVVADVVATSFVADAVALEIIGVTGPGGSLEGWQESAAGIGMLAMAVVMHKVPDISKAAVENFNEFTQR